MASFEERRQRSFELAADGTKQLIALSTGIVAFTITFSADLLGSATPSWKVVAILSWILHLISTVFGLLTLFALTGQLEPKADEAREETWTIATIWAPSVRFLMAVQQVAFGAALIVTIVFGAGVAFSDADDNADNRPAREYYFFTDSTPVRQASPPPVRPDTEPARPEK